MSETLAERLRQITADDNDEADVLFDAADLIEELQDEVERLRAENERLRTALEKIAQHDMQAVAMDALQPGERIRPTEKKFRDALVEISTMAGDPSAYWTAREALGEEKK